MSKKDFEDLLERHKNKSDDKEINWEEKKNEWKNYISEFHSTIESWLNPYRSTGKLSYEYKKTRITEDYIGSYDVDTMIVDFAGQELTLEPIGTLLIGTKGRIDMEGTRGRVQFVLADKDSKGIKISASISIDGKPSKINEDRKEPNWVWKIVLRQPRRVSYEEFNEENFFDALMEVVNG